MEFNTITDPGTHGPVQRRGMDIGQVLLSLGTKMPGNHIYNEAAAIQAMNLPNWCGRREKSM